MGCLKHKRRSSTMSSSTTISEPGASLLPASRNLKQETLLQIPSCTLHLMEAGESMELARGDFTLFQVVDQDAEDDSCLSLATVVSVGGGEVQWPLTKDEPVVKLDDLHYLYSLPMKEGDPLSYGITFPQEYGQRLGALDGFLGKHCCFSAGKVGGGGLKWEEFAPKVDDYNGVLGRAIAGGTGYVVKGIFTCSNAYTNQVLKGGEMIQTSASEGSSSSCKRLGKKKEKKTKLNKSLKRVRKLSKMTEKLSKKMLDGVGIATGSVMKPVVNSKAGKKFISMVPGEVLLASLDAVNKILDAAEAAERQAASATSKATTGMISNRFGEAAGEAAEDVFATAGHCACTAWNIFKIRKAINPASSGVLVKTAAKGVLRKS